MHFANLILGASIGLLAASITHAAPPQTASDAAATALRAQAPAQSRKVVQIGNDIVVVSLVPAAGTGTADNIGITRYDATGTPLAWGTTGAWNPDGGSDILFPNSPWHFTAIRDVQVFKDHVWILADSTVAGSGGETRRTTDILAFSTRGEFKGGHFNVIRAEPSRNVIGAGMAFTPAAAGEAADRLLVVAACPDDTASDDRLCLRRFELATRDAWYPSFAGSAESESRWNLDGNGVASTARP